MLKHFVSFVLQNLDYCLLWLFFHRLETTNQKTALRQFCQPISSEKRVINALYPKSSDHNQKSQIG